MNLNVELLEFASTMEIPYCHQLLVLTWKRIVIFCQEWQFVYGYFLSGTRVIVEVDDNADVRGKLDGLCGNMDGKSEVPEDVSTWEGWDKYAASWAEGSCPSTNETAPVEPCSVSIDEIQLNQKKKNILSCHDEPGEGNQITLKVY